MQTVVIRLVKPTEAKTLAELARRTFVATFADSNSSADMEKYCDSAFSTAQILAEIRTRGTFFYIAETSGDPAGYIKLNFGEAQTENFTGRNMEVERIYVDPGKQHEGIGGKLLDFAVSKARSQHCDAVWLGVWEHNQKAIAFYRQRGFELFGEHQFVLGSDVQNDILLRLELGLSAAPPVGQS